MRILKWFAIGFVILIVAAQAIRPSMNNPSVDSTRTIEVRTKMSPEVAAIFKRSCDDCHASTTRWPWYSQVSPVSWYVANDVNEGRRHLALSDWATYDSKRAASKLDEICEQVEHGEMPLGPYLWIHRDARLSESDKKKICDWTSAERARQQQVLAAN